MKTYLTLATLATAASLLGASAAYAQVSVGAHIEINRPGVYGTINIGGVPNVALVQPQPIIVIQPPVVVQQAPVYLYVPQSQQQDWRGYCGRYNACDRPVYFVREDWVRDRYEHEHPGWDKGRKKGHGHGHDHDEEDGDHGNGHDHGHGHGHDEGHGHEGGDD